MADNENTSAAAGTGSAEERKRIRSEIEFPYADLESAIELAQMIHSKAGSSCEPDELAAWMGQSANGGTFRSRLGAARMFGLIETGGGRATLTQAGFDALDGSGKERATRAEAFLNVELFGAMYDRFKGNALPPAAAIERQMEQLGVSPKQKERARQTFTKSAQYAGFIDAATGRFVKPGIVQKPEPAMQPQREERVGGGGGDEPPGVDPIIQGLLVRLPKSGSVWPEADRKLWLQLLEGSFKLIYKDKPTGREGISEFLGRKSDTRGEDLSGQTKVPPRLHRAREKIEECLPGPHRNGFGENLEFSLGGIFKDDEDAAVAAKLIEGLVIECRPRNFSQPERPVIVEYDRKVFIHV